MNRLDYIYFWLRAKLSILVANVMDWIEENTGTGKYKGELKMKYVYVTINGESMRVELYGMDVLTDPGLMDVSYIGPDENGMRINGFLIKIYRDNVTGEYYAARDFNDYDGEW